LRIEPLKTYWEIRDRVVSRGPVRELWHKYLLLKLAYRLGFEINTEILDEIYEYFINNRITHFTPVDKLDFLLSYVKSRGYKLIITTGTLSHDLVVKLIRFHGLNKYVDLVYSTQLVGIPKNDPRFYSELIDLLGVDPWRILHIGDSLEFDVNPARSVGLKTVYYGWRTQCRSIDPQPCIKHLSELYYLL